MPDNSLQTKHPEITGFISHRRIEGNPSNFVSTIHDLLSDKGFEWDIFLDKKGLTAGPFAAQIHYNIDSREFFFFMLEPHTLNMRIDVNGMPVNKFMRPDDWVRRELEYALSQNRTIIVLKRADFKWGDVDPVVTDDETIIKLRAYLEKYEDREIRFTQQIPFNADITTPEFPLIGERILDIFANNRKTFIAFNNQNQGGSSEIAGKLNRNLRNNIALVRDSEKARVIIFVLTKDTYQMLMDAKQSGNSNQLTEILETAVEEKKFIITITDGETYLTPKDVPSSLSVMATHQAIKFEDNTDFYNDLLQNIQDIFTGSNVPNAIYETLTKYLEAENLRGNQDSAGAEVEFQSAEKQVPRWGNEFGISTDMVYLSYAEMLIEPKYKEGHSLNVEIKIKLGSILHQLLKKTPIPESPTDKRRRARMFMLLGKDEFFSTALGEESPTGDLIMWMSRLRESNHNKSDDSRENQPNYMIANILYNSLFAQLDLKASDDSLMKAEWAIAQSVLENHSNENILKLLDELPNSDVDEFLKSQQRGGEDKYWLGWAYFCRASIKRELKIPGNDSLITLETIENDYKLAETYLPNADQISPLTAMPTKKDAREFRKKWNKVKHKNFFEGKSFSSISMLKEKTDELYKQLAQQMDAIKQAADIYDLDTTKDVADKILDLTEQVEKQLKYTQIHIKATEAVALANNGNFLEAIQILGSDEKSLTILETSEAVILYGGVVNNLIGALNEYWFKYKSDAKNPRNFDEDKNYYDAIIKKAHNALNNSLTSEKKTDLRKRLVDRLITLLTNQAKGASLFGYDFVELKQELEDVYHKYYDEELTDVSALHQIYTLDWQESLRDNKIREAKYTYQRYRREILDTSLPTQKLFMTDLEWASDLFYLGRAYSEAIDVLEGMEERLINLPESGGDSAPALARDPNWATLRADFFLMYGNALRSHAWNQLALINDEADNTTFAQELFSKAITKYDAASLPSDYLANDDLEIDAQDGKLLISAWQHIIAKDWQDAIDNVPQEAGDIDNQLEGQIIRVIALSQQGKPTEDVCSKTLAIMESEVHDAHGNHLKTVLEGFCNK